MKPTVEKISDKCSLEEAFKIRHIVFVLEQEVDASNELDEFEETSTHFLAKLDGKPAGTARWRLTDCGVKMERFAVLKEARGKGIGQALVAAVLSDVDSDPKSKEKTKYLYAQLAAMSIYSKFGFVKVGEMFEECNISHYKMEMA
jgi:predicted GNAT family N-acyltransferase